MEKIFLGGKNKGTNKNRDVVENFVGGGALPMCGKNGRTPRKNGVGKIFGGYFERYFRAEGAKIYIRVIPKKKVFFWHFG